MHFLLVAVLLAAPAAGQSLLPDPAKDKTPQYITVSTSVSTPSASPGSDVTLLVDVTPNPGIHVYAPGAKNYLPIEITVTRPAGAAAAPTIYPKSSKILFAQEIVPVFNKPFRLGKTITVPRVLKAGDTLTVAGIVDYQACDDVICFKPAVLPVTWTIAVE